MILCQQRNAGRIPEDGRRFLARLTGLVLAAAIGVVATILWGVNIGRAAVLWGPWRCALKLCRYP